jgi:hypothetical protein
LIAWQALMSHPTPRVAAGLCLRHNLLTVAHALALPIPVMLVSFEALLSSSSSSRRVSTTRRLSLGLAVASSWTAAAVYWGPTFAVGYDLFDTPVRYTCAVTHGTAALWAVRQWHATGATLSSLLRGSISSLFDLLHPPDDTAALFFASALGLLILSALPQLVSFPTATIPTLLGKRLSRTASGWTFLAAVVAYSLEKEDVNSPTRRTLRRGLGVGALLHLGLLVAKVVGVDGGGLLLPGTGLQDLYPSLITASNTATSLMVATLSVLSFACWQ